MNNYFFDLPNELQDKIYLYIHKSYMIDLKYNLMKDSIIRILKKNSDYIDYQSINFAFFSAKNLFI